MPYTVHETKKNLHMTHVDELPVIAGAEGADVSISALNAALTKLTKESNFSINSKYDGAPAVFLGWAKAGEVGADDTDDDYVFIMALKSLFAKSPKIITREHDIDVYYGDKSDLAEKLVALWRALKGNEAFIPPKQIWQGDFMYSASDLEYIRIDGEEHITFQPNTIVYAVRQKSDVGKAIAKSDVGVVWHTRYKGSSLATMSSSHDIRDKDITEVRGVWSTSPFITYEGEPPLGKAATREYENLLSRAVTTTSTLSGPLDEAYRTVVEANKGLMSQQINAFINTHIRNGVSPTSLNALTFPEDFITYLRTKTATKIANLQSKEKKTRPAEREYERWMETLQLVDQETFNEALEKVFTLVQLLTHMKMILLRGYDLISTQGGDVKMFLVRDTAEAELEPTGAEGFVIEGRGYALKLVDRVSFSRANFSPEYRKGWQK